MSDKQKESRKNRVISIATISSFAVGLIIILLGMAYYKFQISKLGISDPTEYTKYKYHYAIISEEADEPFWEAIYQGAQGKGKEQDTYVEKIGSNLSVNYSLSDLMEIAIASKVDGIIIEPNGESYMDDLINKADQAGIPVVTVLRDAPLSNRKSFIGINTYNQGQSYGLQVLQVVNEGRHKVAVLLNSDSKDTDQSIIYSNIVETVRNRKVEVDSATINTQSTFSSEEDIRNIIMNTENPPDVLVCLTAIDTLSAYQAVVDYNKVGDVDIIGYYDSDLILRAIQKNIIHSTMTIDAKQMGAYSVEALTEYRETKRVSDFFSVDINVINQKNVKDYINNESKDEKTQ
ncbi:MAG TPA: substrate-binding domain-containing protein [Mobilitalea sp.]|nr:substrate-binding domain-containing protein [Mobilitalea sp.]